MEVRNTLYVTLALLFPLRVENYIGMRLGANFNREKYVLHFDPPETKNGSELNFHLPETGMVSIVRRLVDLYLDEARPILLQGKVSEYLFVPDHSNRSAKLKISDKSLNQPLRDYSMRHFSKVLPPRLGHLNPHLMRHLAACHWVLIEERPVRAAQILGDKLSTVIQNYCNVAYSAGKTFKQYYESLDDKLFHMT
jgi:integrase